MKGATVHTVLHYTKGGRASGLATIEYRAVYLYLCALGLSLHVSVDLDGAYAQVLSYDMV